ncbi:hypothetical protein BH10PSE12_BH10PSE12_37520 [soil metagenome]
MMNHLTSNRPAMAAIAAVLAFSSTPVLAQEAAPVTAPPMAVAPPVAAAPAPTVAAPAATVAVPAAPAAGTPVFKAPAEVVQAAPAPVAAAPEPATMAEAAPEAAPAPRRETRSRPVQRVATPEAVPAERVAAAAPVAAVQQAPQPAASVTPAPETVAPVDFVPATVARRDPGVDTGVLLAMGAGLIALLGAGAAFAMRRRKPDEADYAVAGAPGIAPDVAYAHTTYTPSMAQVIREPVAEPETVRASAPIAADHVPAGSIEAMVAERPSTANPFLTRKNRLRRAEYLMRTGDAPVATVAPKAEPKVTVTARIDRSNQVYDFGGVSDRRRPFKPATT